MNSLWRHVDDFGVINQPCILYDHGINEEFVLDVFRYTQELVDDMQMRACVAEMHLLLTLVGTGQINALARGYGWLKTANIRWDRSTLNLKT